MRALEKEWYQNKALIEGKKIVSIYFGGGTPILLPVKDFAKILQWVKDLQPNLQEVEITIEANPEDANEALFSSLIDLGINRLSLGVQSLEDPSLIQIGRSHSANKAKEAIFQAHRAGFQNISIDLMYDLPHQTKEEFSKTLNQIEDLPIQHLSLYNLTIEPKTAFARKKDSLNLPKETVSLELLQLALTKLKEMGWERYEISAFCKENKRSLHNIGYWLARPFLGFGPSAFSYWNQERFQNIANLFQYAKKLEENQSPVDFREKLSSPRDEQELFVIALRLFDGVNPKNYPHLPKETFLLCKKWEQEGCLICTENKIYLTEKGAYFYDAIASDLI